MSSSRQSQTTAVVTGAGRGFGSAIAAALIDRGHQVVGVARTAGALADVHRRWGAAFVPVVADATDAETARTLIEHHQPTLLVLNAGATPARRYPAGLPCAAHRSAADTRARRR